MNYKPMYLSMVICFMVIICFFQVNCVQAEPDKAQVIKMWESPPSKEKVLDVKPKGGQRPTNEFHTKHYLTPIATCWDYDIVALQRCGCRLFEKASVCCMKDSTKDCEMRIGGSKTVECSGYGKPAFGLSGDAEPADCKQARSQMDCFKKKKEFTFGPGATVGPCIGSPYFICPKGFATAQEFWDMKCGPTPEDCGCKLVEECSKTEHLKCYNEWRNDKAAVECYSNPKYNNNYLRRKCYDDLKKQKQI